MSSKHSPTPWTIAGNTHKNFAGNVVADARGHMVADCNIFGRGTSEEKNLANAHLVAAAPELLAALEAISDFWAYGLAKPDGAKPTKADHARAEELGYICQSAIAKAKGLT